MNTPGCSTLHWSVAPEKGPWGQDIRLATSPALNPFELPYWKDIVAIWGEFSRTFSDFPEECCDMASFVVAQRHNLTRVASVPSGELRVHLWCHDQARSLNIDLTLGQYQQYPCDIAVLRDGDYPFRVDPHRTAIQARPETLAIEQAKFSRLSHLTLPSRLYSAFCQFFVAPSAVDGFPLHEPYATLPRRNS